MTVKIPFDEIARRMRRAAWQGIWKGDMNDLPGCRYFERCRRVEHGATLIFTRDTAHHGSGWWKNPDYERCFHLSMSVAPAKIWTPDTPDLDATVRDAWLKAFFREHIDKLWWEGPYTPEGKARNVQHWRLFCDPTWAPIIPRNEVYSTEHTEVDWMSWSERQAHLAAQARIIQG